jgi:hypothetical protein|tara:strand:+ start:75 stop:893 length:819 start_codon:yes stop_codon:yes gene_type:complete
MENTKNYLTHWDKFFEDWKKNPKATFDKDEIWRSHKGKIYSDPKTPDTKLDCNLLPQPYLGDINNHSVITLNLNPCRTEQEESVKGFEQNLEKFYNTDSYYKYAKDFPTYDIDFWKNQRKWFKRLKLDESKKPFAIEICPWNSESWLPLSINEKIINYMNQYVFSVIEKAIKYSDVKMVFSVGKAYYEIFAHEKSGFNLEEEISNFKNCPKNWPRHKKNKYLLNRKFSIWTHRESGIKYLNVGSPEGGGNNPPAEHFDEVLKILMQNHKIIF